MKRFLLFLLCLCSGANIMAQNCSSPLRIVALGSSTTWGNGVPSRDSAWAFRFQRYLKTTHNPQDTVIIIAEGGFTTQNIMPTGTPAYTVSGMTFTVNANKNITQAIALAPNAIIVNIPFEDESRNFPMAVTISNFRKIKQAADQAGIPIWITTTQPRPNLGTAGGMRLGQMKDSIINSFGDKAIDFWTGLANAQGSILPAYDAGDGFHLNSAGQRILFDRVAAKQIPSVLCTPQQPVPFVLAGFSVERTEDKLKLNWSTTTETQSLRFLIERSNDSLNWVSIAEVQAAGNSTSTKNYSFTDPTVHTTPKFYRLNMEDNAHAHYYSAVVKGTPDIWYNTPFRLSGFSVSAIAGKLKLDWGTITESNTVRFHIERSTDSSNWSEIATVAAAGNSTSAVSYTFTDNNVSAGQTWFYRLNMEASLNRRSFSNGVKGTVPNASTACTTPIRIVALGSSTTWGNGVPSRDSAWAFRFQRYLKTTHNPQDTVIIIAEGGFTTQNIMPTGTPAYTVSGSTFTVNTNKNITQAIALAPNAIIVNIPFEDESRNFPMAVTISNFRKIKQAADQAGIPIWITTTQPRPNLGTAGGMRLGQMKDSIINSFGDKAIDFWTGLANAQGSILPAYDAGDGFHLNSAGQRILFDRVVDKQIPAALCSTPQQPTPFMLSSFTVERTEDKLKLNWSTSKEEGSLRFLIERSNDSLNWVSIAEVQAAGNSTSTKNYSFTDPTVHTTAKFYRLNMEDNAHAHYYSAVVKGTPDIWYNTPFRLSGFSVNAIAGKLKLDWGTITESNTVRFHIERSTDSSNWSEIATVAAAGNSTSAVSYTFTDNNVSAGQTWFYRLNMEASLNRLSFSNGVKGTVPNTSVNCTAPLRIVVLGSSTAWGNQLPSRDSAWTFRYQRYLKANHNPQDTIINLSNGGYTTQQIMPTGTPDYTVSGITFTVDPNSNITRAIALNPDAIIINMPTNDEARNFPMTVTVANYVKLKQAAQNAGIPLWVTTSQPRGNLGSAAAIRLRNMRDSIFKYFGTRALDFYNGLDSSNGYILRKYNSGDDVHFNSDGHVILLNRVAAASIPDTLCSIRSGAAIMAAPSHEMVTTLEAAPQGLLYPNPATHFVMLPRPAGESFSIEVYNPQGQLVYRERQMTQTRLEVDTWKAGTYFIIINNKHRYKLVKI